jgi:hypothetical protein
MRQKQGTSRDHALVLCMQRASSQDLRLITAGRCRYGRRRRRKRRRKRRRGPRMSEMLKLECLTLLYDLLLLLYAKRASPNSAIVGYGLASTEESCTPSRRLEGEVEGLGSGGRLLVRMSSRRHNGRSDDVEVSQTAQHGSEGKNG